MTIKCTLTDAMKKMMEGEACRQGGFQYVASFCVDGLRRKPAPVVRSSERSFIRSLVPGLIEYWLILVLSIMYFLAPEKIEDMRKEPDEESDVGAMHLLFIKLERLGSFRCAPENQVYAVSLNQLTSDGGRISGQLRDLDEILSGESVHPTQYSEVFDPAFTEYLRQHGLTPESYKSMVRQCAVHCAQSPYLFAPHAEGSV